MVHGLFGYCIAKPDRAHFSCTDHISRTRATYLHSGPRIHATREGRRSMCWVLVPGGAPSPPVSRTFSLTVEEDRVAFALLLVVAMV